MLQILFSQHRTQKCLIPRHSQHEKTHCSHCSSKIHILTQDQLLIKRNVKKPGTPVNIPVMKKMDWDTAGGTSTNWQPIAIILRPIAMMQRTAEVNVHFGSGRSSLFTGLLSATKDQGSGLDILEPHTSLLLLSFAIRMLYPYQISHAVPGVC
jgi:hypothetical protein